MSTGRNRSLKPQDVLILLKIITLDAKPFRMIDLAYELDISPSEITMGLERLKLSGLIASDKKTPNLISTFEFLVYGLKYVFPAELGGMARGIPTAHSEVDMVVSDNCFVWPYEEGEKRGLTVSPLYRSVPYAAARDKKLHRLLALIDSIRMGRAREQNMAVEELRKELL